MARRMALKAAAIPHTSRSGAGAGPSVGKYLLMAYLPPEQAVVGNELKVMYMNELFPVSVAVAGSTPLFDPDDARMKS